MTAGELAAAWAAVSAAIATHAALPPQGLDASVWAEVADGRVARRASGTTSAMAMGVSVLNAPREVAWLSLTDDQLSAEIESLTETALRGRWASPKTLYQRLDLPWPFQDRHWVISLANNATLALASPAWERSWTLVTSALVGARAHTDAEGFDAAESVHRNEGSWLLVPLDAGHTLAVYQAFVRLGGSIPDGAVEAYTRALMDGLFSGVEQNAAGLRARYGERCTPEPGADGRPIPCFRR